jgi:DNA-binding MarR family transcriptional regulator
MLRTERRVLFHLGIYGEMTATDIVNRARIHKTKVSRAVQKLVDRRFVKRERSDSDRRQETLSLTPAGDAAYRELRSIAEDYDKTLEEGFTEEEVRLLRSMLKRLAGFE